MRSDVRELIVVFADCDFWNEPFYAIGSALVLRVRSALSWLRSTAISSSTRAATLVRSLHRRERRRRSCCWNIEVSFWVESFNATAAHWCRGSVVCRVGMLPGCGIARGDWSLAAFARPVPHRAGSLAAFARPGPGPSRKFRRPDRSRPVGEPMK